MVEERNPVIQKRDWMEVSERNPEGSGVCAENRQQAEAMQWAMKREEETEEENREEKKKDWNSKWSVWGN